MDRQTLDIAAPVLCTIGSLAALIAAVLSRGPKNAVTRAALLSGLFGTIGSAAWAMTAYQDMVDDRTVAIADAAS